MRILLIQLAKFGDILQSVPALEVLHGFEVHFACNKLFQNVAELAGFINLHPIPIPELDGLSAGNTPKPQWLVRLLRTQFDIVHNFNSDQSAEKLARAIPARIHSGFGGDHRESRSWLHFILSFIRSRRLSSFNLVDIYRHSVRIASRESEQGSPGMPSPTGLVNPKLPFLPPTGSTIVLQPGSRNRKRQWPAPSFADLASALTRKGYRVQITGTESEKTLIEQIITMSGKTDIKSLAGKTSLSELMRTLSRAGLLITGDTGTMHLAARAGTPVAAIFCGPAFPPETLAWGVPAIALTPDPERFPCYPCTEDEPCPHGLACRKSITAPQLLRALEDAGSRAWRNDYDEAGQVLIPPESWEQMDEAIMSRWYREFALRHFFGLKSQRVQALLPQKLSRQWLMNRELEKRNVPFDVRANNAPLLSPMIWLSRLESGLHRTMQHEMEIWLQNSSH